VVKLLPLYALAVAWQYASVGTAGVTLVLGGGVALMLALCAGVFGALGRQYVAAVTFGVTIAVLGQLGPFVASLGARRGYVASASLVLVVVCALGAVVGYAEVRRLQTGGLDQ
jgi:asparagine N-glycosylation enzyme membrane subunit Stt3